ncbi:MAG: aminotransferase class I/II-fold pyridoxal phosphate-dependent enzyme [bacterium]
MVKEAAETVEIQEPTNGSTPCRVSRMADKLVGSEILKVASDIRAMVAEGKTICNLTVGDFNPAEFRIPEYLEQQIAEAIHKGETNYPPADGMPPLKKSVIAFYERHLGLHYSPDSTLVTCGSRPGIYGTYRAVTDPGDRVVYPVPSWNNNHYVHLVGATGVPVVCKREDAFLPTRKLLEPVIRGARLLSLNSPLNPSGTAFSQNALEDICDLVLEENARRSHDERPLYVLFDQVYWMLTFGSTRHFNPVSLRPEMKAYTIFVDGISKAFAATGVRVGWVVGPQDVVKKMSAIIAHVGAWAPRAEQIAVSKLLLNEDVIAAYHATMKEGIRKRLDALHQGILDLRKQNFPVDAIPPMGAMYLTVRFALNGKTVKGGESLQTNEDIRKYLLREAGLAIVPFHAFGMDDDENGWFRLSVGAVSVKEIEDMMPRLKNALTHVS